MLRLPRRISQSPRVYVADGFAADGEIAHVLTRYDAGADPAFAWDSGIAGVSGELPIDNDPVLAALAGRIERVLGFGCALADPTFRFRRYAPGDHHPAHVDCYAIAGHHLVATALVYLTDALDGGETVFPEASGGPLSIAARAGRMTLWFNYTPDGTIDRASLHRSEELRLGEKATLAWFVYAPLACAAIEPASLVTPAAVEAVCASS